MQWQAFLENVDRLGNTIYGALSICIIISLLGAWVGYQLAELRHKNEREREKDCALCAREGHHKHHRSERSEEK